MENAENSISELLDFKHFHPPRGSRLRRLLHSAPLQTKPSDKYEAGGGGGGRGVLRISSDGADGRIFGGLKFSIPGFFWVGKVGKYFCGG